MNRLTKAVHNQYHDYWYIKNVFESSAERLVLTKLGQLEDLEKELGIDLLTLFKVIKEDQIYFKFFNEIQCWSPIKIELRKRNIYFARQVGGHYASRQPLSNYGKTWALTKEELENDK